MRLSVRARVRGIYATSIAKVLLDKGFELSDLSEKLKERFGNLEGSPEPPHVTVKTSDRSPHHLIVNGFYKEGSEVFKALSELLETSPRYLAKPNLHSAYKVEVDENCVAEVEGLKARVRARECYGGKELVAEVVKSKVFPKDEVSMEEGLTVQGFYAELSWGKRPGVSFSKHVPDHVKADLLTLSMDFVQRGFRVHWRSSSRSADLVRLRAELEELEKLLSELLKKAESSRVGERIYEGEFLGLFNLTLEDKLVLDEVRREVTPTMPLHHSLKADKSLSLAVELGDKLSRNWDEDVARVKEFLLEKVKDCKTFFIEHEKLDGSSVKIGPFKRLEVVGDELVLYREISSEGTYDGLNVKREVGDKAITLLRPMGNYVVHGYFNERWELKGVYVNLNSGVELLGCKARYVDLEVDVVKDFTVRVVDEDELEKYSEHLPRKLSELVKRLEREVAEVLSKGDLERKLKGYALPG